MASRRAVGWRWSLRDEEPAWEAGGHVQIHDQDVGLKFAGEAHGFGEIAGFADDLQLRFAVEKAADRFANHFGIVGEQDFDWQGGLDGDSHKRANIAGNGPLTILIRRTERKGKMAG